MIRLKLFVQKSFVDFIAHEKFLPTKYFQTTISYGSALDVAYKCDWACKCEQKGC